jgi:hypothetical protein
MQMRYELIPYKAATQQIGMLPSFLYFYSCF